VLWGRGEGRRVVPRVEIKGDGSRMLNICPVPRMHFPRLACGQPLEHNYKKWHTWVSTLKVMKLGKC